MPVFHTFTAGGKRYMFDANTNVIINLKEDLYFELPLNGATGNASINANIRAKASSNSSIVTKLSPGEGFKIISEEGEWLKISANGKTGYINSTCCMVNLPDIVPSIVYDDTNSYSSL